MGEIEEGRSTSAEDAAAIRRVLQGERDAYADLVRRHQSKIRGLCAGLLADRTAGDDAAQEVFLKAFRALGSFRGESSFATWLHRIALNHCRNELRSRARRRTDSWDALAERGVDVADGRDVVASRGRESGDMARRVLADLPEDYRTILVLREIQALSYEDIARAMNCTLDSVKARLRRARAAVQERARHLFEPSDVEPARGLS